MLRHWCSGLISLNVFHNRWWRKKFYNIDNAELNWSVFNVIKLFYTSLMFWTNKLECLSKSRVSMTKTLKIYNIDNFWLNWPVANVTKLFYLSLTFWTSKLECLSQSSFLVLDSSLIFVSKATEWGTIGSTTKVNPAWKC